MNEVTWQRRGLIHVPVVPEPRPGRPPKANLWSWDNPEDVKAAHAFWNHGARDLWTREGERVYQSKRKRVQRSRMSAVDRAWCEKNVVKSSWEQFTRTNRDASVANTT